MRARREARDGPLSSRRRRPRLRRLSSVHQRRELQGQAPRRPCGARHVSRVQGADRGRARHESAGDLRRARGTRSNPSCSLATRWQSSVTSNVDRDIDRGFRRLLLVLTAHCLLVGGGFAWRTITLPPRYIYTVVNGDGLRIPVDTEATSDLSETQRPLSLDGHGDERKHVLSQAYE